MSTFINKMFSMSINNYLVRTSFLPILECAFFLSITIASCKNESNKNASSENQFAPEMVEFVPYSNNPVFTHGDSSTWDNMIRERGFILNEDSIYKMWYTGYK